MAEILVLNTSPRRGGNTETLAEALAQGARDAGKTAEVYHVCRHNINPCMGCYACMAKKGDPCVQKDDMREVYALFNEAQTVVFASPLYWWGVNAQMKIVIDRMFAIAAAQGMAMPHRGSALLIAAEDAREENFALVKAYYQTALVHNLGWQDKGMLLAGGIAQVGDAQKSDWPEKARQFGAGL